MEFPSSLGHHGIMPTSILQVHAQMHAWTYMYNICHICTHAHWTHATHTHEQYANVHTQYMWIYTHTGTHNVCRTYTRGRHICMHTQYTQHDMYIWTYIFPAPSNHLAALCSSTREAQPLTGFPQPESSGYQQEPQESMWPQAWTQDRPS